MSDEASLCETCTKPGLCCTRLTLNFRDQPETALEALVKLATTVNFEMGQSPSLAINTGQGPLPDDARHVWVGLPFMPLERVPETGAWRYWCPLLVRGRCSVYDTRPPLCRSYEPGKDGLCAMHKPDAPDAPA